MADMEYFCCFNTYLKKTRNLSDSELGRLFRALMNYNATGEKAQLNGREETAFDFIVEDIDAAKEKYAARCEQNRANRTKQTSTTVDERYRPLTNVDENDQTKNKKQKTKDNNIPAGTTHAPAQENFFDSDFATCFQCYEQNCGTAPRYVSEKITEALQKFPPDLICLAIDDTSGDLPF